MSANKKKKKKHTYTQHSLHHIQHKTLSAPAYLIIVHIKSLWQLSVFL